MLRTSTGVSMRNRFADQVQYRAWIISAHMVDENHLASFYIYRKSDIIRLVLAEISEYLQSLLISKSA